MILSLLQWNIWYKEPISNIARYLDRLKPDIFCAQELMHHYSDQEVSNTAEYLAATLNYKYFEKIINIEGEEWQQANGIFSRFPILSAHTAWLNKPHGTDKDYSNEYRAYVEASLDIGASLPLSVATTHLSYTDKFQDTPRKCKSLTD